MATTKPDSGVAARHEGTLESVYAGDSGVDRLKPNAVGLWGVIFVAVTGAAPISAMLFNVPFSVGFGTGLYTPGRVPVRDDHPHDLLGRLRRDGAQDARRGRLLHVHLARPRP